MCHLSHAFVIYRALLLGLVLVMILRHALSAMLRLRHSTAYLCLTWHLGRYPAPGLLSTKVSRLLCRWDPTVEVSKLFVKGIDRKNFSLRESFGLLQLLNSTIVWKQPQIVRKQVAMAVFQYNFTMDTETWISCIFHVPQIIFIH